MTAEYRDVRSTFTPDDFPSPLYSKATPPAAPKVAVSNPDRRHWSILYLARVPPAVAGQHGDIHTFRTRCRLVRGFRLDDDEAFELLCAWNAKCRPPWKESDLRDKIRRARMYGREPIGALLYVRRQPKAWRLCCEVVRSRSRSV